MFRIGDLLHGALESIRHADPGMAIDVHLIDMDAHDKQPLVRPETEESLHDLRAGTYIENRIHVGGREWLLVTHSLVDPVSLIWAHWLVLLCGIIITLLTAWIIDKRSRYAESLPIANAQIQNALVKLNEAQHIAKVGSWILDLRTNQLDWSDETYTLFERDKDQFRTSYESFLDAIHPDDRERVNRAYTQSVEQRENYSIDHRLLLADGRVRYIQERGETIYDSEGKPLLSQGTVQDVTQQTLLEEELKRSYDELRQQRNLLQSSIDNIPMRVFWKDRELRYPGRNPSFAKDTGLNSPADLIGKDDCQMAWADHAERYRADDLKVMESGGPLLAYEEPITTSEGRGNWVRTSKVPLQDGAGEITGMLGITKTSPAASRMSVNSSNTGIAWKNWLPSARNNSKRRARKPRRPTEPNQTFWPI